MGVIGSYYQLLPALGFLMKPDGVCCGAVMAVGESKDQAHLRRPLREPCSVRILPEGAQEPDGPSPRDGARRGAARPPLSVDHMPRPRPEDDLHQRLGVREYRIVDPVLKVVQAVRTFQRRVPKRWRTLRAAPSPTPTHPTVGRFEIEVHKVVRSTGTSGLFHIVSRCRRSQTYTVSAKSRSR